MRGATVVEVRGISDPQVQEILDIVGLEIINSLQNDFLRFKVPIEPLN